MKQKFLTVYKENLYYEHMEQFAKRHSGLSILGVFKTCLDKDLSNLV